MSGSRPWASISAVPSLSLGFTAPPYSSGRLRPDSPMLVATMPGHSTEASILCLRWSAAKVSIMPTTANLVAL